MTCRVGDLGHGHGARVGWGITCDRSNGQPRKLGLQLVVGHCVGSTHFTEILVGVVVLQFEVM